MAQVLEAPGGLPRLSRLMQYSDIILALGVAAIVGMMIVPLPEIVLDVFICVNISAALVMMLVSMYITEPLQFSSFPSLLLIATLFRLALNVSASRLILLHGHAGSVIASFGSFVVGGNYVVGVVIFLILIVIQFVVITNGAGRVAEVAARFTLDAMPGKQMSIDADLNAGSIDEETARARRRAVAQEADFYGAMDGASKFVKGDAIAGVVMIVVNIIGGLIIGVLQLGMPPIKALQNYTLMTVGDGLVSQIPAILISTATGLIVTRAASDSNLGTDVARQVLSNPRALFMVAGLLGTLGLIPGLPTLPFLTIAAVLGGVGYLVRRHQMGLAEAAANLPVPLAPSTESSEPENVRKFLKVDPIELEIGYALITLTDVERGGTLLGRVTLIRRQMALDLGIILPTIRIRDSAQLAPNQYALKLRGVQVATGEVRPNRLMAMNPGMVDQEIPGIPAVEPAFGLPAIWISPEEQEQAEVLGYTVVDPASVIITHLSETIRALAPNILSRQDVQSLLDHVKEENPVLVQELVPDLLTFGDIQRVLQNLLRERVSVRDLVTILEAIADQARVTKDPELLAEHARQALGRQITSQYLDENRRLAVITLAPSWQQELARNVVQTERGPTVHLEPNLAQQLIQLLHESMERLAGSGHQPVLLCPARIRLPLRRFTELSLPSLVVVSFSEIVPNLEVVTQETVHGVAA
jgi:flagellar biosynthesis protein FlhA